MTILTDRPHIRLKVATSLDGMIATRTGHSQWITGPDSRRQVHEIRAASDVIVTGIGTILADDPSLTARLDRAVARQPDIVIFDSNLRTPTNAAIFETPPPGSPARRVILFHSEQLLKDALAKAKPLANRGANLVPLPLSAGDLTGLCIGSAMARLYEEGYKRVMVEAGGRLAASFLRAGVVDRLDWFRAPMIIGGEGRPVFGGVGIDTLDQAVRLIRTYVQPCAEDVWETYQPK